MFASTKSVSSSILPNKMWKPCNSRNSSCWRKSSRSTQSSVLRSKKDLKKDMFVTSETKSWTLDKSIWPKLTSKTLTSTSLLTTEEKTRINKVRSSRTLLILRSLEIQLLKKVRAISTHLRVASTQTNNKIPATLCRNMTYWTSKTPVKLVSLVRVQVLPVVICSRVLIHLTRTTLPCKCSYQIMRQIFLSFWVRGCKELILKWKISPNMFTNSLSKLIKG